MGVDVSPYERSNTRSKGGDFDFQNCDATKPALNFRVKVTCHHPSQVRRRGACIFSDGPAVILSADARGRFSTGHVRAALWRFVPTLVRIPARVDELSSGLVGVRPATKNDYICRVMYSPTRSEKQERNDRV